jgi:hypothetical protein
VADFEVPSDYAAFKASVLSDLDDDSMGVYEAWWEANTRYPDWPVSRRLALAEHLVTELVLEGRAEMFVGRWIGPDHERTRVDDPIAALKEWACWVPQEDRVIWLHLP